MRNDGGSRKGWPRFVYDHLGDDWLDRSGPPGCSMALDFGEPDDDGRPMYVARAGNDGSELWIGFRDKWLFHCWVKDARRLAWFVLWRWWVIGTWCGLKRWLWFQALHRIVAADAARSRRSA